jgi:hypothetical protein
MITLMVMALSMLLKVGEFLSSTKSACWLSPFCRKLASLSSVSFAEDKHILFPQFCMILVRIKDHHWPDLCSVLLRPFPPATVKMKPLLSVYPWTDSDQNVGNLLMVLIRPFLCIFKLHVTWSRNKR